MRKTTTIVLDMTLVGEAAVILGTNRVDETVHAALGEVVASRKRLGLIDLYPDLTLERLEMDRTGRSSSAEPTIPQRPQGDAT